MPSKTPQPDPEQFAPSEAADSFDAFLSSLPADASISVSLYRLPSYIHPQVTRQESLPPVSWAPDLEIMSTEIRARYGPGRYKLYIRLTDPTTRRRKIISPEITLAPVAEDFAEPAAPAAEAESTSATLEAAMQRRARAIDLKSKALELSALEMDPGAGRQGESVIEQVKAMSEILRNLQPPAPPAPAGSLSETVALLKVVMDYAPQGGGGGEGGPWTFATRVFETLGPHLPGMLSNVLQILNTIKATPPAPAPAAPGGSPVADLSAPAPVVAAAPNPAALGPVTPVPGPDQASVLQAVDNDPARAQRMRAFLDFCYLEMDMPPDEVSDSLEDAASFLDRHLPGYAPQLLAVGAARVWELWMLLDPRVLNKPAAGPWVRGLYDLLERDAIAAAEEAQRGGKPNA